MMPVGKLTGTTGSDGDNVPTNGCETPGSTVLLHCNPPKEIPKLPPMRGRGRDVRQARKPGIDLIDAQAARSARKGSPEVV